MSESSNQPINQPANPNPYNAPQAPAMPMGDVSPAAAGDALTHVMTPIVEAKGWMKLMGIMSIIAGALYCLTIIGAIIGWLPIWMGILLNQASDRLGRGDVTGYREAMEKMKTWFVISGVLTIIGIVIMALYFLVIIGMLASGSFPAGQY